MMAVMHRQINLYYHTLRIRFTAPKPIKMSCWFGAVLRNRFLKAADNILDNDGTSLRLLLNRLPLSENQFLYNRLSGGFPKSFLFRFDDINPCIDGFTLEENRIYSINLIIIGDFCRYVDLFSQAIDLMFSQGFGHPITPLSLIDICEESSESYIYSHGKTFGHLSSPIRLEEIDEVFENQRDDKRTQLQIKFRTPTSLISSPGKIETRGYQSRLNNFPSLYQIMRSACYRMATLSMLYCDSNIYRSETEMDKAIEDYLSNITQAILLNASISWQRCYSTPRKNGATYQLWGYTGQLLFDNTPYYYIPILYFMQSLAIGNDINYGLGAYSIRYQFEE